MKLTSLDSLSSWESIYIPYTSNTVEVKNHEENHFENDRNIMKNLLNKKASPSIIKWLQKRNYTVSNINSDPFALYFKNVVI